MQDEISRPVRPHERQREYIATEIVAEYLKSYFGCDAVIYKSSMQRDNPEDNRNMVILHRETFVGTEDPSVLSYVDWSMQDVTDVRYSTVDGILVGRVTSLSLELAGEPSLVVPSPVPRVFRPRLLF
jgi:hypothetical protein